MRVLDGRVEKLSNRYEETVILCLAEGRLLFFFTNVALHLPVFLSFPAWYFFKQATFYRESSLSLLSGQKRIGSSQCICLNLFYLTVPSLGSLKGSGCWR